MLKGSDQVTASTLDKMDDQCKVLSREGTRSDLYFLKITLVSVLRIDYIWATDLV